MMFWKRWSSGRNRGACSCRTGSCFPNRSLWLTSFAPSVHHKPMNLLNNTERLGLLKEPSRQPGALYDEARQHLQVLEARNEVHEDFLAKHVTSWSQLSEQQARVMLNFFVACALLSEIENRARDLFGDGQVAELAQCAAACDACGGCICRCRSAAGCIVQCCCCCC